MGTFTTGVGLISGLPISSIIDQLMAIEARPRMLLQARVANLQAERTALLDISARLLAIKNAIASLATPSFFRSASAVSSDPHVLTAAVGENPSFGSFSFRVLSLASNHQVVSRGFADADRTPLGAGSLSIELGNGRLDRDTPLEFLNGQQGIRRGTVRITDRSGATADIDLTAAGTVGDVLEAINAAVGIDVFAEVQGDHIVLADLTGGARNLLVRDVGSGRAAADLGIAAEVASDRITGTDVNYVLDSTLLRFLNDGNGVRRRDEGTLADFTIRLRNLAEIDVTLSDDLQDSTALAALNHGRGVQLGTIRITDRSGASAELDLAGATTVGDVIQRIDDVDIGVSAVRTPAGITISDTTGRDDGNLIIEDISGSAAADLRIAGNTAAGSIASGTIYEVSTIGDVIRAINFAPGNDGLVVASLDGRTNRLVLSDTTDGDGSTQVVAAQTSDGAVVGAAADLGLVGISSAQGTIRGERLIAGLNTTLLRSLNGGRGVSAGSLTVVARDGTQTTIDLAGARTVREVIDRINETTATSGIAASLNAAGTGIRLTDVSGGTGSLEVLDSQTARDLGLVGVHAGDEADGGNLQLRYVSEATRLDDLNFGRGVARGAFRITTSTGASARIDLSGASAQTVGDLLRLINSHPSLDGITAEINETGDGILIRDASGGQGRLTITEEGSTTARDLNILGEAGDGGTFIDGSFEIRIDLAASDTLNDLSRKLNSASDRLTATVINDGGAANPFRLSITSTIPGRRGEIVLDTGGIDLRPSTLSRARDAVLQFGAGDGGAALVVTSASNTIRDVLPGLTLNLLGTSDDPVTVTVSKDVDKMVSAISTFVSAYNDAIDRIEVLTDFDEETQTGGILLGDATVLRVRSRLNSAMLRTVPDVDARLSRLSAFGVRIGSGAKLLFDEQAFRNRMESDPAAVEAFFAGAEQAFAATLEEVLDELTDSADGLIARQNNALQAREDLLNERIEALSALLEKRRERLTREFEALETALAQLQAQQQALTGLTLILPQTGAGGLTLF